MTYALGQFLSKVLEHGGLKWFFVVVAVLGFVAICAAITRVAIAYIRLKMKATETMQTELFAQLKMQHNQSVAREARLESAFREQVKGDHRFQAKAIEAVHTITDVCKRIEHQNGEDHATFLEAQHASQVKMATIGEWVVRHT